ncbi:MAG: hypothetical protein PHV32_08745 [Eubacteriales bacterium]|nr:hypothetical protein [Eubacteriales bacterium]
MLYIYDSRYKEALDDHYRAMSAVSELRKRGISPKIIKNRCDIKKLRGDYADSLFIPFSFSEDMHEILIECNKKRIPVTTTHNYPDYFWDCSYNTISRDTKKCMRMILSYLRYNIKPDPKIAYFGTTPLAYSDRVKINTIYSIYRVMEYGDIYFNNSCFADCFESFFENRNKYDAVICANSYIAVAFIKSMNERDPECAKRIKTVSFLETEISKLYYTSVTIAAYNEASIYDSAVRVYKMVNKNDFISSVNIELDNEMLIRESSGGEMPPNDLFYNSVPAYEYARSFSYPKQSKYFTEYVNDPYLKNIVFIERLLCSADITDLKIISAFLNGVKNTEVAEQLFISLQTVHYRSQAMFKILETENKRSFISIISEYISAPKLNEYIREKEEQ